MEERKALIASTINTFEKELVTERINHLFDENAFNGEVSIKKDSVLIYERSQGFENFSTQSKLDENSIFAIGSISKQFTATLVLLEEEKGDISTTDKVSKYLAEFDNVEYREITIHQLLNHTSGLNDFGNKLLFKSGTEFSYSNKGYRYLGQVLESVSGKSYDQLASELFNKAHLTSTYTPSTLNDEDFASAYTGTRNKMVEVINMPERLASKHISVPAGGILSTVNDLHRWNFALHDGKILSSSSLKKLRTIRMKRDHFLFGTVGYGYGIMSSIESPKSFFHTGYVKGSPSLLIYYPATKTSAVVLSNVANELSGKKNFFSSHQLIMESIDDVQNAVVRVKEEMNRSIAIEN